MGNCCRVYAKGKLAEIKEVVKDLSCVKRFGDIDETVVEAVDSVYGNVDSRVRFMVEINFVNDIEAVCERLKESGYGDEYPCQDIDGYGWQMFKKRV